VSHVLDSPEDIQGVANFRRSKKHPRIYGVHQPSTAGLKALVEQLTAEHGTLIWVSVRDNPVVYVNGCPYTVHSKGKPEEDSLGIKKACVNNGRELSRLERQLAKDLVVRASTAGGQLQLFPAQSDKDDKDIEPEPTQVPQDGISTFQGLFDALEAEGFGLKLHRCMFVKDGAPEPEEMDELVAAVRSAGDKAAIVINCGSGVERTQVAMVMASLMYAVDAGAKPKGYVDPPEGPAAADLREKGQYKGIVELCQSLEEGPQCKAIVDDLIDDNDALFNMRKMVFQAAQCDQAADFGTRSEAVCKGMDHLERYWYLICFGAYLRQQVTDKFQQSFSTWLRSKRGIRRSLHKLCLV